MKQYAELAPTIRDAVAQYAAEVRGGAFPEAQHTYAMPTRSWRSRSRAAEVRAADDRRQRSPRGWSAPTRGACSAVADRDRTGAVAVAESSLALIASTRNRNPIDTHRLAEFEKRWLAIVVAILVALLAATIWFTPYGKSTPSDAQVVSVSAQQFLWRLNPSSVRVDVPVAFVTRSQDVNHGFGIYKGRQVHRTGPGRARRKTQTLVHTFHETGHVHGSSASSTAASATTA